MVGGGAAAPRLVAAPFLAAADRAAALRPFPAGARVLFFFDPVDPVEEVARVRPDPLALAPPVLVPLLRLPDRLAVVRAPDPALRAAPSPAEPLRAAPDLAELRLAPRGGTLGRIGFGDSSL